MARRQKGDKVDGWLVLDNPSGMTSTQAVGAVRRIFQAQKAGHAGTLDPLATGILPIGLGEATKTVSYVVDGEKAYRFTVRWGVETTTDDAEGEVLTTSDIRPLRADIEALLPHFCRGVAANPGVHLFAEFRFRRPRSVLRGRVLYDKLRVGRRVARTILDAGDGYRGVADFKAGRRWNEPAVIPGHAVRLGVARPNMR